MAAHVSLVSLFLVLSAEGVRVGTDSSLLVPSGITSSSGSLSSAAGSLRPDFSHVALTYLGRERVLAFDQWTGEHALWSLERNEVSKCDAFMWPPLSAGRWAALRYHEFVFVGFTQLIAGSCGAALELAQNLTQKVSQKRHARAHTELTLYR